MENLAQCVCDPATLEGSPYIQWIGTYFGACSYTTRDYIGFLLSLVNLSLWIVILVPQLVLTCRKGDASGLAPLMLCMWYAADFFGLIGLFLTGQGGMMFVLQVYFFSLDQILVGQWIFFTFIRPPPHLSSSNNRIGSNAQPEQVMFASDVSPIGINSSQYDQHEHNIVSDSNGYHHFENVGSFDNASSNNSSGANLLHQQTTSNDSESTMLSTIGDVFEKTVIDAELVHPQGHHVSNYGYQFLAVAIAMTLCFTPQLTSAASSASVSISSAILSLQQHLSTTSLTSTTTTTTTTPITTSTVLDVVYTPYIPLIQSYLPLHYFLDDSATAEIPIIKTIPLCNMVSELAQWKKSIGIFGAWLCACLNGCARIPQVLRIYRRKTAYGMARISAILTVIANCCYLLSIFLPTANAYRYENFTSIAFLTATLPYAVYTSCVFIFSCIILTQMYIYRDNNNAEYVAALDAAAATAAAATVTTTAGPSSSSSKPTLTQSSSDNYASSLEMLTPRVYSTTSPLDDTTTSSLSTLASLPQSTDLNTFAIASLPISSEDEAVYNNPHGPSDGINGAIDQQHQQIPPSPFSSSIRPITTVLNAVIADVSSALPLPQLSSVPSSFTKGLMLDRGISSSAVFSSSSNDNITDYQPPSPATFASMAHHHMIDDEHDFHEDQTHHFVINNDDDDEDDPNDPNAPIVATIG